jgi:hypothetical protein
VDRTQLLTQIQSRCPLPGETVYLQRRGDSYDWHCVDPGSPLSVPVSGDDAPDAWLFFSGAWPVDEPERLAAHLDDMLAEMETMCGTEDRCRWPLDQPYPLHH